MNHFKITIMKKFLLKIYDKLIVAILFSAFFLASCEPDEPQPEYGVIVPMYGVPATTMSVKEISEPTPIVNDEKTDSQTIR